MKVGIVTYHFVNNFGGALQAYALQRAVKDNFDVEDVQIIDYRNWFIRFTDTVRLFPITTNPKTILSGLKTMNKRFGRKKCFKDFLASNVHQSKFYGSSASLKKNPPALDKFICGSDQIWNPMITMGIAPAYFLDFVADDNNKCAYAPSFGKTEMPEKYQPKVAELVNKIPYLSVREREGVECIKNYTDREFRQMIDPTFLIAPEEWKKVAHYDRKLPEKYILVYIMQANDSIYDYVKELKAKYNLPVIDISRYGYNPGFVDETIIDIGPAEFLELFNKATITCTNSYHGLVFSLIFRKQVFFVPSKKFAIRMQNLFDILGIDRTEIFAHFNVPTEVQYDADKMYEVIEQRRAKSIAYLSDFLGGNA